MNIYSVTFWIRNKAYRRLVVATDEQAAKNRLKQAYLADEVMISGVSQINTGEVLFQ